MTRLSELKTLVRAFFSTVTIEPAFFLFALSQGLYLIIVSELYISKVCKVNLALGDEICDNIQLHKPEQALVQQSVSRLTVYTQVLQSLPAVLFTLLAGPWSDVHKNGRKTLIVLSLFGNLVNNAVFMINTHFFYELRAEYLLFECLQDCTGGIITFFLSVNAYMADITEPWQRTKRVAFMTGLWPLGKYLGKVLSGPIKIHWGFMYNFGLAMAASMIALLYVVVFVEDSIGIRDRRLSGRLTAKDGKDGKALLANQLIGHNNLMESKNGLTKDTQAKLTLTDPQSSGALTDQPTSIMPHLRSLFDLSNLTQGWRALTRQRPQRLRLFVVLMFLTFQAEAFVSFGERSLIYLYLRRTLDFTLTDFTQYSLLLGLVGFAAQYLAIPFLSGTLKLHDSVILAIAVGGCSLQALVTASATVDWVLYLGVCLGAFDTSAFALIRCVITKHVQPDEVGKILSIVGAVQSVVPLVSGPVLGTIYRNTVASLPQAYLLVTAALLLVECLTHLLIYSGVRRLDMKEVLVMDAAGEEVPAAPLKRGAFFISEGSSA